MNTIFVDVSNSMTFVTLKVQCNASKRGDLGRKESLFGELMQPKRCSLAHSRKDS